MKVAKIGFPELSSGAKNPLGRGTSKIVVFAKKSKNARKIRIVLFCGGQNSAGVHNKRLGPT